MNIYEMKTARSSGSALTGPDAEAWTQLSCDLCGRDSVTGEFDADAFNDFTLID